MSAFEKALREAASKFKSFTDAVNAHLRNAFDRGATDVRISYNDAGEGSTFLMIEDNGRPLTRDQFVAVTNPSPEPGNAHETLALTGVHHARMLTVDNAGAMRTVNFAEYDESKPERYKQLYPRVVERDGSLSKANVAIQLWYLGAGDGVDPRQDRTAARLIKRLPAMLTPREAGMVTVVDEKGTATRLSVMARMTGDGEYVVWIPEPKASFDHGQPLALKYGGVRMSVDRLGRAILRMQRGKTSGLYVSPFVRSPWLTGTIEIARVDGATEFPDPRNDFPDAQYENGFVEMLSELLLTGLNREGTRQAILRAADGIWTTVGSGNGTFRFDRFQYAVACRAEIFRSDEPVQLVDAVNTRRSIEISVIHPLFQADDGSKAVGERMLWAVAEFLHRMHDRKTLVSNSYLDLREAIDKARG